MIGSSNKGKGRPWPEPRLRDLTADQDLAGVSELIRAAAPLPAVSAVARQRMRARLRQALRPGIRGRARWWAILRPVAIVLAGLMIASAGGAAVYTVMSVTRSMRGNAVAPADPPGRAKAKKRAGRLALGTPVAGVAGNDVMADGAAVGDEPAPSPTDSTELLPEPARVPPPAERRPPSIAVQALPAPRPSGAVGTRPGEGQVHGAEVGPAPVAEPERPARLGSPPITPPPVSLPVPVLAVGPAPLPLLASRATIAPAPSDVRAALAAPSSETELLAGALRQLHAGGNPEAALADLDELTARFPRSTLAAEVAAVRIEALLKAGHSAAALAELDRSALDGTPGYDARLVVRGELRAQMARWGEAEADFSRALGARLDRARDDLAERALWGRSAALAQLGDAARARESGALYLRRFPNGRFSSLARQLSQGPSTAPADETGPQGQGSVPGPSGTGSARAKPELRPSGGQ